MGFDDNILALFFSYRISKIINMHSSYVRRRFSSNSSYTLRTFISHMLFTEVYFLENNDVWHVDIVAHFSTILCHNLLLVVNNGWKMILVYVHYLFNGKRCRELVSQSPFEELKNLQQTWCDYAPQKTRRSDGAFLQSCNCTSYLFRYAFTGR